MQVDYMVLVGAGLAAREYKEVMGGEHVLPSTGPDFSHWIPMHRT